MKCKNIVIGAGSAGLATAYHLTRRGEEVTVLEQFSLGHKFGSSHSETRITRHAYRSETYALLMPHAYRAWTELEAATERKIFVRTGGITLSDPQTAQAIADSLKGLDVPCSLIPGERLARQFPQFRADKEHLVVFEPDAGIILAAEALRAQAGYIREHNNKIIEDCEVTAIEPTNSGIRVSTSHGEMIAERVVVCAGPWVGNLMPALQSRTQVSRQPVCYFTPPTPIGWTPDSMPIFIYVLGEKIFYGIPAARGLGIKVADDSRSSTTPQSVNRTPSIEDKVPVLEFVKKYMPELKQMCHQEVCLYTDTPNSDFILDKSPTDSRVTIVSACSGHGFKLSHLVGKIASQLCLDGGSDLRPDAWKLSAG